MLPVKVTIALFAAVLLVLATAMAAEPTAEQYRLGPEDVITVTVARHTEFSGDFLVPDDGTVSLPVVGPVNVTGTTLDELSECIKNGLRERLREPEVNVTLKVPGMRRIYVIGTVGNPGAYDLKPGWRVTEAIAAGGGLSKGMEASDCTVTVLHPSGEKVSALLSDVISGVSEANIFLQSGDVVTVAADETFPVYVVGKVKTPGLYRVSNKNGRVMEAITLAGGTLDDAMLSRVTITHLSGASDVIDLSSIMLGGDQTTGMKLQAGDLVLVPETTARIAVLGFVKEPGFYPLKDGQKLTLTDAVGLAKGTDNKRAGTRTVAIIRTVNGVQEKLTFDLRKFLREGDITQNPEIMPGDVVYIPETGKPDWDIILRAVSSVGVIINPFIN